jgi:hypothetical protein
MVLLYMGRSFEWIWRQTIDGWEIALEADEWLHALPIRTHGEGGKFPSAFRLRLSLAQAASGTQGNKGLMRIASGGLVAAAAEDTGEGEKDIDAVEVDAEG